MDWITLFSFSGKEASVVTRQFKERNLRVWTNNPEPVAQPFPTDPEHFHADKIHEKLARISRTTLVTLHGYNRILPERVIKNPALFIYNVHPGDVVEYPSLVGLHPQRQALQQGLCATGVVIHRVTTELDLGPVVARQVVAIKDGITEAQLIDELREVSIGLWLDFLQRRYFK